MYPRAPNNTQQHLFKADVFEQSCSLVEILSTSKCIKEYPDRFEEFALTGKTVHQYRSKFNRDVPSIRTEGEKWENWGWAPACGILRNGALGERRIVNTLKDFFHEHIVPELGQRKESKVGESSSSSLTRPAGRLGFLHPSHPVQHCNWVTSMLASLPLDTVLIIISIVMIIIIIMIVQHCN